MRGGESSHLDTVLWAIPDYVSRYDTVGDDLGLVVDVFKEEIEGAKSLIEAFFDVFPLGVGHEARNAVYGDDAFACSFVAVDDEGDAFVVERASDSFLHGGEFDFGQVDKSFVELAPMRTRVSIHVEHLVVEVGF